ncbi:hypothetical protein L210DRAFT_3549745 [Boletus edulis BED1]|uniref:Uncharacterized protein n=1 Tax=Boletus edulis BED1 TaxID=1328754 RepID=A0AAD4BPM7_BOLED|nr:hypothetical protein L210DRAFT_3549745 [Boletus edulis BED1]
MIIIENADAKPTSRSLSQVHDQDDAARQFVNRPYFGSVQDDSSAQSSPHTLKYTSSYHTTPPLSPPPSYPQYPVPSAPTQATVPHPPLLRPNRRPPGPLSESPAKRFWKAFAFAFLIYLAFLTLIRSMASGIHVQHWDSVGIPRAEDGRILESIGGLNWTTYQGRPPWASSFSESAETSFTLPTTSESLYLISRGSYQSGKVEVKQSTTERGGGVKVDVRVAYHDERALARATVCRLRKSGNKHGVGIYTPIPGWTNPRDRLYFQVIFTFPAAPSEQSPLRIHELKTHASSFAHELGDLWQSLMFDNLELDAPNAPIQAHSVTLTRGSLTSSNGAIVGHFNTSDALILHTSNAHIRVTASLFNTARDATKLDMRTSNGQITSSVSLTTASGSGGNFVVTARSSNGGVKLQYHDAPTGARLVSDARTSNAAAEVAMHPAYEGTYEVSTSNAQPVVRDTRPADPEGRGRRRVVDQKALRGIVSGRVYWVREDGSRRVEGVSTVHTSNARASLDL